MENRQIKERCGKSEYKEFIIDIAKSQQYIDTQIGRISDEFQKNESSEESHELEREEYRDTAESGELLHGEKTGE